MMGYISEEQGMGERGKKLKETVWEVGQTQILQGQGHAAGKPSIQPSSLLPWGC